MKMKNDYLCNNNIQQHSSTRNELESEERAKWRAKSCGGFPTARKERKREGS